MIRVLVVDHHDSFTYNLVQALRFLGADVDVVLFDEIAERDAALAKTDALLLSPGPCTPSDAAPTLELVRSVAGRLPILGVCLGHQAIAQAFGARVVRAHEPKHGMASAVRHQGRGSLSGLPSPFDAGRYHSLVVDASSLPPHLRVTATTGDGSIMALYDAEREIEGVQFHPESVLTPLGSTLLATWLERLETRRWN